MKLENKNDERIHKDIMSKLFELMPKIEGMEFPPKIFIDMQAKFVEFVEGESLSVLFPNQKRYMNPFALMQGGMITAAIDNTISPFSYVVGKPNVIKEILTQYKRPVGQNDRYIIVKATLVERLDRYMILKAEVRNEAGKLVAKATAKCVFVSG